MLATPPAPGGSGRRLVVPIRPCVPLKYETSLRGGGNDRSPGVRSAPAGPSTRENIQVEKRGTEASGPQKPAEKSPKQRRDGTAEEEADPLGPQMKPNSTARELEESTYELQNSVDKSPNVESLDEFHEKLHVTLAKPNLSVNIFTRQNTAQKNYNEAVVSLEETREVEQPKSCAEHAEHAERISLRTPDDTILVDTSEDSPKDSQHSEAKELSSLPEQQQEQTQTESVPPVKSLSGDSGNNPPHVASSPNCSYNYIGWGYDHPPQYLSSAPLQYGRASNGFSRSNILGGRPPPTPSSASVDDGTARFDPKLAGHVSSNFDVEKYADMRLIVTHEEGRFNDTAYFLHRVLVSRSETLRDLLVDNAGNYDDSDSKTVVKIRLTDRFITPIALRFALKTCYGQSASSFFTSKYQIQAVKSRAQSAADMLESLAFAAAGHLLRLEDVALQGIERAQEIMNWDNVQHALSFGIESCTHRSETPESSLLREFTYTTPDTELHSVNSARSLLEHSLWFFASQIPHSWHLDRYAPPLPIVDRLPSTGGSHHPRPTNPKLASIQFGEHAPEVSEKDTFISSILLSLPLAELRFVASGRAIPIILELPNVIEERERRRLEALTSDVQWNLRRLAKDTTWYAVGYQERCTQRGVECAPVSIYSSRIDEEEARMCENSGQLLESSQGAWS